MLFLRGLKIGEINCPSGDGNIKIKIFSDAFKLWKEILNMNLIQQIFISILLIPLLLFFGCSPKKLTQLNTDKNKTISACGYKASQMNKGYSWYKFTDSNNRALGINEIRFGEVGKDTTNNIIATDSCLAFKKLKNTDYYVYTFNSEDRSGNILESDKINLSNSLNVLHLTKMNENPVHFRSCGEANRDPKDGPIYAIEVGFHDEYKAKKDINSILITKYIHQKSTKNIIPNKYGCFYFTDNEKNQIIEIRNKDSREIIYRRPLNIWTQGFSSSKITICGTGIYGFRGKCVSHFQYYCEQKEHIESKYKNLVDYITPNKMKNCAEKEQYIKNKTDIRENGKYYKEVSFEPIFYLNHFSYIGLKGRQIEDLTALKNFQSLETLSLPNNNIRTLSGVEKLGKLSEIFLKYNKIQNLDNFTENFQNLEVLDLSHNPLKNLNPIKYFTNLRRLFLNYTNIENLELIGKNTLLEDLYMEGANVSDISFISNLINLTTIDFNYNGIENISPMEELIKKRPLEYFDKIDLSNNNKIGKNRIDFSGLDVDELRIADCGIKNISFLEKINILWKLDLQNNEIENLQLLKNRNIKEIEADGNPIKKDGKACPEDGTNDSLKKFCYWHNKL